nr:tbmE [Pseudomonas sp.]
MSVVTNPKAAPYKFPMKDVRENFPAALLYIGWEDHLMFCAPVCLPLPPDMPFGALMTRCCLASTPSIRTSSVSTGMRRSGSSPVSPGRPMAAKSLAENGLGHKDVIRFRTRGLTGIKGSCS